MAQKDMNWSTAPNSEDYDNVIAAFLADRDALFSTVLVSTDKDDPDCGSYHDQAITARYLLDLRRSGMHQACTRHAM